MAYSISFSNSDISNNGGKIMGTGFICGLMLGIVTSIITVLGTIAIFVKEFTNEAFKEVKTWEEKENHEQR